MSKYQKPALPPKDIVSLLISRGLDVPDRNAAERLLTFIGYFRLVGYMLPFRTDIQGDLKHHFDFGASFPLIVERYSFDRKLRLVVMDAIERIEVAIRAAFTNIVAQKHGVDWYKDSSLFVVPLAGSNRPTHSDLVKKIQAHLTDASDSVFLKHYYATYKHPADPPSWMVMEVVSMGTLSKLYSALQRPIQKSIAKVFATDPKVLNSWLRAIVHLRNLCAHHSRLFNRRFAIMPIAATAYAKEYRDTGSLYAMAVTLQILMKRIAPDARWGQKFTALIGEVDCVPLNVMGIPLGWQERDLWRRG